MEEQNHAPDTTGKESVKIRRDIHKVFSFISLSESSQVYLSMKWEDGPDPSMRELSLFVGRFFLWQVNLQLLREKRLRFPKDLFDRLPLSKLFQLVREFESDQKMAIVSEIISLIIDISAKLIADKKSIKPLLYRDIIDARASGLIRFDREGIFKYLSLLKATVYTGFAIDTSEYELKDDESFNIKYGNIPLPDRVRIATYTLLNSVRAESLKLDTNEKA